ncbi:WD40 repeat-like protein [Piromyces finnis]|uniref:WD40 repeat-like protein n=1 Tax=Piromyces finnis TaxID=1754191 RepID=A0A1Y1VKB3_9FUNG|nr:WD40 repeat-like protein [Piromyces finnis]|eukprot:ORX58485.1 WD40 repeat-like protein [Piromyces finnis]
MTNCTITSDEINYLIYRYLVESGFKHTSFMFQHETHILQNSNIKTENVKPGALIHYLQKGLLYTEVEYHANEDGTEKHCIAPFSLLTPHHCKTEEDDDDKDNNDTDYSINTSLNNKLSNNKRNRKERKSDIKRERKSDKRIKKDNDESTKDSLNESEDIEVDIENSNNEQETNLISQKDIVNFVGNDTSVYVCSWNPVEPLLATGSKGTASIWTVPESPNDPIKPPIILDHKQDNKEVPDVTSIEWNPSGTLLATGAYDGLARIWNKSGQLVHVLKKHTLPIFSLKWNFDGNLFLTASVDKTVVIWDSRMGEFRQQYSFHSGIYLNNIHRPVMDVDWKDNTTFASCSTDKQILVCQLGSLKPLKRFIGHEDEVNIIKWDPESSLLASCSDDRTACVWSLDQDDPICTLKEHKKEIYTIKWCPNSTKTKILATASFDCTIKLWDVMNNICLYTLRDHNEAVYSVSFSPNGLYLASGSFDQHLNVWSVETGTLMKTYIGESGIFETSYNKKGDKIAVCFANCEH